MEKSRKILDVVFKCISKLSDDEIESLINKKYVTRCKCRVSSNFGTLNQEGGDNYKRPSFFHYFY